MNNLLFISSYPFPLDMGSKQHAYYFLKALTQQFNVYCVFFLPPHTVPPTNKGTDSKDLNIKDCDFCFFDNPSNNNKYVQLINKSKAFPNSFMNLATNSHGLRTINSYIDKYSIHIVHFEHFWYTKYAFYIDPRPKKVIVYHDLHHSIYKQQMKFDEKLLGKFLSLLECAKFYLFEYLLEKRISLKIFLNPTELQCFPNQSVHIPHIANPDITFKPVRESNFCNILFLGTYNHPPNRLSFKFIIAAILPQLTKIKNNFKIHIIGPGTEKYEGLLENCPHREHVTIHRFIQDINQVFDGMDLALFPILYGGGIKTKIIDSLKAGVPVVTTPEGVIGLNNLPENCIGVGKTPNELINEMINLMNNFPLRLERSQRGRDYVEKEHSFKSFSKKVKDTYVNI